MKFITILLLITAIAYGAWYSMLSADVARVKASIEYQEKRFKTVNRAMTFKAASVSRSGFPLALNVRINRPQLTMIWGNETYGISAPWMDLQPINHGEGRYRLKLPPLMEAVYAKDGQLPEQYFVSFTPTPQAQLRAVGNSSVCPPIGKPCEAAEDAPINAIAFGLPDRLVMHVVRGTESRDAVFTSTIPGVPIFMDIPADASRPLVIGVNVLREALSRPQ